MMNLITVILIGIAVFILGMLWRARIRKSKIEDPDFQKRDETMNDVLDKE